MSFTTLFTKARAFMGIGNAPTKGHLQSAFKPMSNDDFKAAITANIEEAFPHKSSQIYALKSVANLNLPSSIPPHKVKDILTGLAIDERKRHNMQIDDEMTAYMKNITTLLHHFVRSYPSDSENYLLNLAKFTQLTSPTRPCTQGKVTLTLVESDPK